MPAARIDRDPGNDLPRIAVDERHATVAVETGQHSRVRRIDPPIEGLAIGADVMTVLVALDPDARLWKQIRAVEVIRVDMRDDDVGDVLWPHAELGQGCRRRLEAVR